MARRVRLLGFAHEQSPVRRRLAACQRPVAIGHVAGSVCPPTSSPGYMRMAGHDVLMVSGTDEHGTPILIAADEAGVAPQELADKYHRVIVEDLAALGVSYDLYTRTTTPNHHAVVQELFRRPRERLLRRADDVRRDLAVHRLHPARPLHRGHLPDLRVRRRARRPVRQLRQPAGPARPQGPRSKINGETPQFIETQHFFLDLPALADALGEWSDEREATGCGGPT